MITGWSVRAWSHFWVSLRQRSRCALAHAIDATQDRPATDNAEQ
jgi:hypothetical protein